MAVQQVLLGYSSGVVTYTTLNSSDKGTNVVLSDGNLTATASAASAGIARSVATIVGKKYFEVEYVTAPNGTATTGAGVANGSHVLTASLGFSNPNGWAFWGQNTGARHNGVTAIAVASANGVVLGFAVDQSAGTMWIRKDDGTWLGGGDPAAGTSPIWTDLSGTLYAAACPWSTTTTLKMRFDPATFAHSAPSGFGPLTA